MAFLFEVMNKSFVPLQTGPFAKALLDLNLDQRIWETQAYLFDQDINQEVLSEVFVDPLYQAGFSDSTSVQQHLKKEFSEANYVLTVGFKAGVTDNTGLSASDALKLFDLDCHVSTIHRYYLQTSLNKDELQNLAYEYLFNNLIQSFSLHHLSDDDFLQRFERVQFPQVRLDKHAQLVEEIDFTLEREILEKQNKENCWALSIQEIDYLKMYFQSADWLQRRERQGLSVHPTDVEVEVIAQSWSEHCKHKIFSAEIDYSESVDAPFQLGERKIKGLYPELIKKSTYLLKEQGKDWLISVFKDNAGIVRFDEHLDLCLKVETHNSPSALDPYGGALTGILGVNRDILGTGLGAKPVANLDVFCLAPPSWPLAGLEQYMPQGLKTPKRLLEGVHKGVEDGGNKSGIPTVGGAIVFDQDFAGKPLVFVGTMGVMPQKLPSGKSSSEKRTKKGDKIVVIGGAVGADGIHGATFSSLELNEDSPSTAVQIGDPLTQKRVMDLLLVARDLELYSGITDNGAGGISSSLGEMATLTNGASFDLALCPLKYPNLRPFEIMISESQERMSLSVDPLHLEAFLTLCREFGVSASVLGEFTDTGYLEVFYDKTKVVDLSLDFLHESLPKMELKALWSGPRERTSWMPLEKKNQFDSSKAQSYKDALLQLLQTPNIASKEQWVRQYDHEVQGATALKPFQGKNHEGPSDAGGIWMGAHGGNPENVICLSLGLAPRLSLVDPYLMAQVAVDEAVRNLIASGGDPEMIALLDNFCWPDPVQSVGNPEGERKCAELVRACLGLYDAVMAYQAPLISGKDSMKNDFRGKNKNDKPLQISILPTLLVTAMSKTKLDFLTPSVFQKAGDVIYVLGLPQKQLSASEFAEIYEIENHEAFVCDLEVNRLIYRGFFEAVKNGLISSAHDVSDGGALTALAESSLGAMLGAELSLSKDPGQLFSEAPGRFVVTVDASKTLAFEEHFASISLPHSAAILKRWGVVTEKDHWQVSFDDGEQLQIKVSSLRESFLREF